MDNEIQLISDGDGLAVIGHPAATAAALRLLADWPALARSFGDKNFGLVREIHLIATDELDGRSREMAPPHEGAGFEFRYGEH
ncbi:hypothetical protein [Nonomuraea fuscirosea]|uniref:hypothetical protein n=1 Tax=Nonomuraea fuscirosea TaxID=1291556 RepID=UPI0033EA4783